MFILAGHIDRIAPDDKDAERRLHDLYDRIYKAEDLLQESMMKKAALESMQMSVQSRIGILSSFDVIYDRMNAAERRDHWSLITKIQRKIRSTAKWWKER